LNGWPHKAQLVGGSYVGNPLATTPTLMGREIVMEAAGETQHRLPPRARNIQMLYVTLLRRNVNIDCRGYACGHVLPRSRGCADQKEDPAEAGPKWQWEFGSAPSV
jgi:hypothetical protein